MVAFGLAGVNVPQGARTMWANPAAPALGNNLPPVTGAPDRLNQPGPGYPLGAGGQLGGTGDGQFGSDPRAARRQPYPRVVRLSVWQETTYQYGTEGFNDKLTVKDRHVYWDTGRQTTGTTFDAASSTPNAYNNPRQQPPRPDLRAVNRTVSYQKGSDSTANQDDLSRPYTKAPGTRGFVGEQGSGWAPIWGGVPGLYQPYGTRGGIPFPIQSPVQEGTPGDGPHLVFAGPPHGLHTNTPYPDGAQTLHRFYSIPQTRPVRQDRPSNSPQAGQSYSQTVRPQGASPVRPAGGLPGAGGKPPRTGLVYGAGRGWVGRQYRRTAK
jgi:hypothetical protein